MWDRTRVAANLRETNDVETAKLCLLLLDVVGNGDASPDMKRLCSVREKTR